MTEFVRQVRFRLTGTPTSVEEMGTRSATYRLDQNYPNHPSPSTVLSYGLADRSQVSLILYDALGREVATLARGIQEAGEHSINLDARQLGLASGIYWYRLSAGTFTAVRSMVLIQ